MVTREHIAIKPVTWRWTVIWAVAGLLAFVTSHLLALAPHAVERVYTSGIWPLLARPLSRLTGLVPLALGEILLAVYIAWLLASTFRGTFQAITRKRAWSHALAGGARRVLRDGGFLVFWFYVLWGFNYARPAFEARAGWPQFQDASVAELVALSEAAVAEVNNAYRELHDADDAGEPTRAPADFSELESAIDEGWMRTTALLELPRASAERYGRLKRPLTSILQRLGIVGIYSPFTAESNVPRDLPAMAVAHTVAHEKAHQRGVTSEAEANLLGFVAASRASHPLSRYSASLFAARQLLGLLFAKAPAEARRISALRLPGVRRDRADYDAYWRRYEGPLPAIASSVNHRYLRANRVRAGVADYARSATLLVLLAREHSLFER